MVKIGQLMSTRRFPPPRSVEDIGACFLVVDSAREKLAMSISREPGRRTAAKLLSKDEVRRIAANIAKLPEFLWESLVSSRSETDFFPVHAALYSSRPRAQSVNVSCPRISLDVRSASFQPVLARRQLSVPAARLPSTSLSDAAVSGLRNCGFAGSGQFCTVRGHASTSRLGVS